MGKSSKKSDERSEREAEAIRDAALKRALAMPAKKHSPSSDAKKPIRKAKGDLS